jgi:hypothetical protein
MRAGERVALKAPQETIDFVRSAKSRSAAVGASGKGFTIGLNGSGDQVVLGASLMTLPGEYSVTIAAVSQSGEKRTATVNIIVDPLQSVPSSSSSPPVVLLNGYQFSLGTCPISTSTPTFCGYIR